MPLDIHGHRFVYADRDVVRAVRVRDDPFSFLKRLCLIVQRLVKVTHGGVAKINGFHVRAP
ncbi:hypothetical protein D3C71_1832620 [compost metagenome]